MDKMKFNSYFLIAVALPVLVFCYFLYQALDWISKNFGTIWGHDWYWFILIGLILSAPLWWKVYTILHRHIMHAKAQQALIELAQETKLSLQEARIQQHGIKISFNDQMSLSHLEITPVVPRLASRSSGQVDIREEKDGQDLKLLPPGPLPTFVPYETIRHQVPEGHALVGIDASGIVTRDREVRALTWIVGGSGTGKTNSSILRIDEDYEWGHWFIPIDPHWFKKDSLYNAIKGYADRFIQPLAYETEDIIKSLDYFLNEFDRRKSGGSWDKPITIIIDEVGSLVTDGAETKQEEEMIAKIKKVARICGQESRGFGMTGIYISQDAAGLAWLRKRALMVIVHQLMQMSERLLACNDNRVIAREMDDWPKGRTLIFGIGFEEGQKVYQQPAVKPRVIESTISPVNSTQKKRMDDLSVNPNYNPFSRKSEPLNVSSGRDTDPSVNALKTASQTLVETASEDGLQADTDELETDDFFEEGSAQKNIPDGVSADILETIRRMKKVRSPKPLADREISAMVGLSGRKYPLYQAAVRYLESVNNRELV